MSFDPANLRYNAAGLIPAIAQDETTGEVLMMAWMNQDALPKRSKVAASPIGRARDRHFGSRVKAVAIPRHLSIYE